MIRSVDARLLWFFMASVFLLAACEGRGEALSSISSTPLHDPEPSSETPVPVVLEPVFEGDLRPGQTLSDVLADSPLPTPLARELVKAMQERVDLRSLQPGHRWKLELNGQNDFRRFQYIKSPEERFVVEYDEDGGLRASLEEVASEIRPEIVSGTIQTSLYESVVSQGKPSWVAMGLINAFQWDINFYTDPQPGDRYKALVDIVYIDGKPRRLANVLMAVYDGATVGHREAVYYDGDYYDDQGNYLQKTWLTTPLDVLRVTSRFGQRFHPILKRRRRHTGIDYGAAKGTPVWAVADGRVLFAGNKRDGYGNQVLIQHSGGYRSRYAHLSTISVKRGQHIRQKQRVGRVGKTGRATAPHLHFEILVNGKPVNPAKHRMLPIVKKTVKNPVAFQEHRAALAYMMEDILPRLPEVAVAAVLDVDEEDAKN